MESEPWPTEPAEAESTDVELLRTVYESQQQHGLRHGDYQRYRQYCSRRIRRLRRCLKAPLGHRRGVYPKLITADQVGKDCRFLLLVLAQSERAWSYSMQLRVEYSRSPEQFPRKKFHLIARLRKAVKVAGHLQHLAETASVGGRTKLEIKTYSLRMRAALAFELRKWPEAVELYKEELAILERLAEAFSADRNIVQERISELQRNRRYAASQVGDADAMSDLLNLDLSLADEFRDVAFDDLIAESRAKQAARLAEVTWLGRTVPVRQEKVRASLLAIQDCSKQLGGQSGDVSLLFCSTGDREPRNTILQLYDRVLRECSDALQVVNEELRSEGDSVGSNLSYLRDFLVFLRSSKTIERSIELALQVAVDKPQDCVRLFTIVLNSFTDISSVHQLMQSSATMLNNELQSYQTMTTAVRAFFVAQTCFKQSKWVEAVAMAKYAMQLYDGEKKRLQTTGFDHKNFCLFGPTTIVKGAGSTGDGASEAGDGLKTFSTLAQFYRIVWDQLPTQCSSLTSNCHLAKVTQSDTLQEREGPVTSSKAPSSDTKNRPLSERLDVWLEVSDIKQPNLTAMPPHFEPVPCRPLFFDLAANHIAFPDLSVKIQKKKGWFSGWGWFSAGKK